MLSRHRQIRTLQNAIVITISRHCHKDNKYRKQQGDKLYLLRLWAHLIYASFDTSSKLRRTSVYGACCQLCVLLNHPSAVQLISKLE